MNRNLFLELHRVMFPQQLIRPCSLIRFVLQKNLLLKINRIVADINLRLMDSRSVIMEVFKMEMGIIVIFTQRRICFQRKVGGPFKGILGGNSELFGTNPFILFTRTSGFLIYR